jgi:hypothetical protein
VNPSAEWLWELDCASKVGRRSHFFKFRPPANCNWVLVRLDPARSLEGGEHRAPRWLALWFSSLPHCGYGTSRGWVEGAFGRDQALGRTGAGGRTLESAAGRGLSWSGILQRREIDPQRVRSTQTSSPPSAGMSGDGLASVRLRQTSL